MFFFNITSQNHEHLFNLIYYIESWLFHLIYVAQLNLSHGMDLHSIILLSYVLKLAFLWTIVSAHLPMCYEQSQDAFFSYSLYYIL